MNNPALPPWLYPADVPTWPTYIVGTETLGLRIPIRQGWAPTGPETPTGQGHQQVFRGHDLTEWLVVETMDSAVPGHDMTQWVMPTLTLTGFPIVSMLELQPQLLEFGQVACPGYAAAVGADEAHTFVGMAAVRVAGETARLAQLYIVLLRRGTTAWKIELSFLSACPPGTGEGQKVLNDHVRAGASFGQLSLTGPPVVAAVPSAYQQWAPSPPAPSQWGPPQVQGRPSRPSRAKVAAAVVAVIALVAAGLGAAVAQPWSGGSDAPLARIAYESADGLYLLNIDGSERVRLTESDDDTGGEFSPDGTKFVFATYEAGISLINADGTGRKALTDNPGDYGPEFSPDGTTIVFGSEDSDENDNLFVMNADGSGWKQLTKDGESYAGEFSPDGSTILFDTSEGISVINADGTRRVTLTDSSDDRSPVFSPDGSKIAFIKQSFTEGYRSDLYLMNADGTGQTQLTKDGRSENVSFSPDGTKIAFTQKQEAPETVFRSDIFVINLDGSMPTRLTSAPGLEQSPQFSPDGAKIVYLSSDENGKDEQPDLYVMNADGSGQAKIGETSLGGFVLGPGASGSALPAAAAAPEAAAQQPAPEEQAAPAAAQCLRAGDATSRPECRQLAQELLVETVAPAPGNCEVRSAETAALYRVHCELRRSTKVTDYVLWDDPGAGKRFVQFFANQEGGTAQTFQLRGSNKVDGFRYIGTLGPSYGCVFSYKSTPISLYVAGPNKKSLTFCQNLALYTDAQVAKIYRGYLSK